MTESQPEIQPEHYSAQEFVRLQKQNQKNIELKINKSN